MVNIALVVGYAVTTWLWRNNQIVSFGTLQIVHTILLKEWNVSLFGIRFLKICLKIRIYFE